MNPENPLTPARRRWLLDFFRTNQHAFATLGFAGGLTLFVLVLPGYVRTSLLHGFLAQRSLMGLLVLFGLLALSLLWSAGEHVDQVGFLFFNLRGRRPRWMDGLMLAFTQLGNGATSLTLALMLYLFHSRRAAIELVLGTLSLWLCVELIKSLVKRPRPFLGLIQTRVVGLPAIGRSFPSGHTSQAFFLAVFIGRYFALPALPSLALIGLALLVGLTRMYVGAHYPRDVLAGMLLGSLWGLLVMLVNVPIPLIPPVG
jgi:membrane-associated phospholipid phosphatase